MRRRRAWAVPWGEGYDLQDHRRSHAGGMPLTRRLVEHSALSGNATNATPRAETTHCKPLCAFAWSNGYRVGVGGSRRVAGQSCSERGMWRGRAPRREAGAGQKHSFFAGYKACPQRS